MLLFVLPSATVKNRIRKYTKKKLSRTPSRGFEFFCAIQSWTVKHLSLRVHLRPYRAFAMWKHVIEVYECRPFGSRLCTWQGRCQTRGVYGYSPDTCPGCSSSLFRLIQVFSSSYVALSRRLPHGYGVTVGNWKVAYLCSTIQANTCATSQRLSLQHPSTIVLVFFGTKVRYVGVGNIGLNATVADSSALIRIIIIVIMNKHPIITRYEKVA